MRVWIVFLKRLRMSGVVLGKVSKMECLWRWEYGRNVNIAYFARGKNCCFFCSGIICCKVSIK